MEELNKSMGASAASWFSELEMEDYSLFDPVAQCHSNLLDVDEHEFLSHDIASALHSLSSDSYSYPASTSNALTNAFTDNETSFERSTKQQKTNSTSWNSSTITDHHFSPNLSPTSSPSSSPTSQSQILSFENTTTNFYGFDHTLNNPKQNKAVPVSLPQLGNVNSTCQTRKGSSEKQNSETKTPQGHGTKRSPAHAQDHIMAERKRREKLSQSLIALAALIPGLKKMDKASVLGDAIKYVKELKERLRLLEEERNKKALESVVVVNKPQVSSDDDSSSCDESLVGGNGNKALPHVEARVADKEVLLRIHCQKHKGLLVKILAEIQNLHLFVINSSVLPFGDSILDITIVAQMSTSYNMRIKDLVKTLRVATLKSMS